MSKHGTPSVLTLFLFARQSELKFLSPLDSESLHRDHRAAQAEGDEVQVQV